MAKQSKVKKQQALIIAPVDKRGYLPATVSAAAAIVVAGREAIERQGEAQAAGKCFAAQIRSAKDTFLADPKMENSAINVAYELTDLLTLMYRAVREEAVRIADSSGLKDKAREGSIADYVSKAVDGLAYAKKPILELVGGTDGGATLICEWRNKIAYVLDVPIDGTCTHETTEGDETTEGGETPEGGETGGQKPNHEAAPESRTDAAIRAVESAIDGEQGIVPAVLRSGVLSRALRAMPTTKGDVPGVVEWLREIIAAIEADCRVEGIGPMRAEWIRRKAEAKAEAEAARLRGLANAEAEAASAVDKAVVEAEEADKAYQAAAKKLAAAPDSAKAGKAEKVARQLAEDAGFRLANLRKTATAAKAARLAG